MIFGVDFLFLSTPRCYWERDCQKKKKIKFYGGSIFLGLVVAFKSGFKIEMTKEELLNWRLQFVISNFERMGLRYQPFCFTEQGMTMLSCVLNSERAIRVNIQIIRIFTRMRELLIPNRGIPNFYLQIL